jgi:hypothetical protein
LEGYLSSLVQPQTKKHWHLHRKSASHKQSHEIDGCRALMVEFPLRDAVVFGSAISRVFIQRVFIQFGAASNKKALAFA